MLLANPVAVMTLMEIPTFYAILIIIQLHVFPCVSLTSFVFGDSLVDAGNNDYLFTLSKADSPPYGIDFLPSGGKPTGRFTNGRTISDIIGIIFFNHCRIKIPSVLY